MKRMMMRLLPAVGAAVLACAAGSAHAGVMFSFMNITNNNPIDAAIGQAQLSMSVDGIGNDAALFTFHNSGPQASSITDVYFDDDFGALAGISDLNGVGRVDFSVGAAPRNLPGGSSIDPKFRATSSALTADSDAPTSKNGVNPGELLTVAVDLKAGVTVADLLRAIDESLLRVGIHVQAFASGGSESFINVPEHDTPPPPVPPCPPPVVPEPSSFMLLGLGAVGLAAKRWRGRK